MQKLNLNFKKAFLVFFVVASMFFGFGHKTLANDNLLLALNDSDSLEVIQSDVRVNDLDINPINTQKVKKNVVPDTKKEGKRVLDYFLRVMGAVLACAAILYLILVFVKKFYGSAFALDVQDEYEELNLSSPETKEEALKSFLNRTKF